MVAYSFAFFLPTILLYGMGFSLEITYILIFPPYVLAAVVSSCHGIFLVVWPTNSFEVDVCDCLCGR